jgi:dodecin
MAVGKIIEVVASSKTSWEDAAKEAIGEAAKSVRGITGIDIQDWTAKVKDNKIIEYRVNAKIVFGVEKT